MRANSKFAPLLLLLALLLPAPAGCTRSVGKGPAGLDVPAARKVLGVTRESNREEIRAAFRKASLVAHPDKDGGSTERFVLVGEAYEVLRHGNEDPPGDGDGRGPHGHAPPPTGESQWNQHHSSHRRGGSHHSHAGGPEDETDGHPWGDWDRMGYDPHASHGSSRSHASSKREQRERHVREQKFTEFTRSKGAWDATSGDGWGGDRLWDSPNGRRAAFDHGGFQKHPETSGGAHGGSSRKWYERGQRDAAAGRGRGPRRTEGGGGRGQRGARLDPDEVLDAPGYDLDDDGAHDGVGHARTNPNAKHLHDVHDGDGAIPQGPAGDGGGQKWWERRAGGGGGGGGERESRPRSHRFPRTASGADTGRPADAFHGGYGPPEGADTHGPGGSSSASEGSDGSSSETPNAKADSSDGSSESFVPDADARVHQSEPPRFDDDESMEEYVARRAYADSFGMTGHDRSLGGGLDDDEGSDASVDPFGGVPEESSPNSSSEGMSQVEWEWRLEDLEAALEGKAWGAVGPGANPGNAYLCADGVDEFCVA